MERKMTNLKAFGIFVVISIIILASWFAINSYADDETYTGEFITANKVYMPDNNIKLVIYFNGSGGDIHFKIFDDWDARHSILLSNMEEGTRVKIYYKEYVFRDCREIVRVEML